jgi:hypothetical protein
LRPIIAVRGAGIRVIVVVTVWANRRRSYVNRADSDTDAERNRLRMGRRRRHQANTKYAEEQ